VIILDTNVLSALMRNVPEKNVIAWLDQQPQNSIWTSSITILEIQVGLQITPMGRKRTELSEQFEQLIDSIDHRIAAFDEEAARLAANLTAHRQRKGRVGEMRDTMIAGIVMARRATLATRNVTHFADISATVVNPWVA
jgi:predicted nucleic acid-binding protein